MMELSLHRPGFRAFCLTFACLAVTSLVASLPVWGQAAEEMPVLPGEMTPQEQIRRILSEPEFRRVQVFIEERDDQPREVRQRSESNEEQTEVSQSKSTEKPPTTAVNPIATVVGTGLQGVAWVLIGGVCALIIVLIARAILTRDVIETGSVRTARTFEEGELPVAPGEQTSDHYLQAAEALAARGEFREAVGQLVLGLMSATEHRGLIRYRQGLTHRDYLRAQQPQPSLREAFRKLVRIYEPICFGRQPATAAAFEAGAGEYRTEIRHA